MIYNFYAVKDELVGKYLAPVMMMTDEEAMRQFKTQVNTIPLWKENPSDWGLYKIGQFNDANGDLILSPMEKLASGRSVVNA